MVLPTWLTGAAAQGLQWGANVNQALGSKQAANSMRAQSSAIRDPNQVYQGSILSELLGNKGAGGFVLSANTAQQPTANAGGDNPNKNKPTGPFNPYGGGGTASRINPDDAAYYDDQANQLQRLLQSADVNLGNAQTSLNDSFNLENTRLNEDQSRTLRDFATRRTDTLTAKNRALEQVDTDARNGYNALQRLLGMGGAGVSSAARELVPYAVSMKATRDRGGQLDTYGRNIRDLTTAEGDAQAQYRNTLDDLARQKREKEQGIMQGTLTTKQDLVNQIAQAKAQAALARGQGYAGAVEPYRDQYSQYQNQLDALFNQYRNPTYDVKPVNVQAPNLQDYTVDNVAVQNQGSGVPDETIGYLPRLLRDRRNPSYI